MSDQAWVPDLLQPNATSRIDAEQTRFSLNLAFAGSSAGGLFSEALDRASMPASTWEPSLFAKDMFLQRLSTRIVEMTPEGIVDFKGNYDDYLRSQGLEQPVARRMSS